VPESPSRTRVRDGLSGGVWRVTCATGYRSERSASRSDVQRAARVDSVTVIVDSARGVHLAWMM